MLDLNQSTPYDEMTYDPFVTTCQNCQKCPLSEKRTQVVVGHGNVPCNLMIIGEGPGEQEDLQGKPFVGKSGKLLTKILESVGIDREADAYIANTVKCRPPGNRTPHHSEIEACLPYLIRQIHLVQPKVLLLLGNPSLKTILGDHLGITKERGKWFKQSVKYMTDPLYIMPLFHPAYLLRNASKDKGAPKWLTWQDAQEVKAALSFYTGSTS
jgi:uracil-DNA glycosylase family 4